MEGALAALRAGAPSEFAGIPQILFASAGAAHGVTRCLAAALHAKVGTFVANEFLQLQIDAALAKQRRLHLGNGASEFQLLLKGPWVELVLGCPEYDSSSLRLPAAAF